MSERSKGFKIGAIGLFVGAMALLSYVLITNNDQGPDAVPVSAVDATPASPPPEQPTVVNAQATEEPAPAAEAPVTSNEEPMSPEKVKKARSMLD